MTSELRRNFFLALAGLGAGFAMIVALIGAGDVLKRRIGGESAMPASRTGETAKARPEGSAGPDASAGDAAARPDASPSQSGGDAPAKSATGKPAEQGAAEAGKIPVPNGGAAGSAAKDATGKDATGKDGAGKDAAARAPSFDLVRVEPTGEAVVAGRGLPNTTVEMLVNGKPVARALADPNGQFAVVPPALPAGDSEIVLRVLDPQGRETRSVQSVSVVVAPDRRTRPLVALTAPDKPTVVLSQPEALAAAPLPDPGKPGEEGRQAQAGAKPEAPVPASERGNKAGAAPPPAGMSASRDGAAKDGASRQAGSREGAAKDGGAKDGTAKGEAPAAPRTALKIVSVDAQEGGRLYVTGQAAPGATLRLYLNDTLVAPASVGGDGRVVFTIGRGVAPGQYRVRLDQVDPVSGAVRARAEVPFLFPQSAAAVASASREGANPPASGSAQAKVSEAPAVSARRPDEAKPRESLASAGAPSSAAPAAPAQAADDARSGAGRPAASTAAAPATEPPAAVDLPATAAARMPGSVFVPEIATATIARGDNLWQISRKVYGRGTRYTVIYDANQNQIRDPDRIYPGQIFVLPKDDGTVAVPDKGGRG